MDSPTIIAVMDYILDMVLNPMEYKWSWLVITILIGFMLAIALVCKELD